MSDEHLKQAAVLLGTSPKRGTGERQLAVLEALVHAVLHLAEVVDIRESITSGR